MGLLPRHRLNLWNHSIQVQQPNLSLAMHPVDDWGSPQQWAGASWYYCRRAAGRSAPHGTPGSVEARGTKSRLDQAVDGGGLAGAEGPPGGAAFPVPPLGGVVGEADGGEGGDQQITAPLRAPLPTIRRNGWRATRPAWE